MRSKPGNGSNTLARWARGLPEGTVPEDTRRSLGRMISKNARSRAHLGPRLAGGQSPAPVNAGRCPSPRLLVAIGLFSHSHILNLGFDGWAGRSVGHEVRKMDARTTIGPGPAGGQFPAPQNSGRGPTPRSPNRTHIVLREAKSMCLLGRMVPEQLVQRRGRRQHPLNREKEGDIPDPHLIVVSLVRPYCCMRRVTAALLCVARRLAVPL